MLARDSLRLHAFRSRSQYAWVGPALKALSALDPTARLLNPVEGLDSLAVSERLRDLLPDEHFACRFQSFSEQDEAGAVLIERLGAETPVTLHLGYGQIAFAASLKTAWLGWGEFCESPTDAHNACLYPAGMPA